MAIWGQLELFCRAITEEGRREAEGILATARAEAERIIAEAKDRADRTYEREILLQRGTTHAEARRIVDSAELEARRQVMAFREEMILQVLRTLEDRLRKLRDEPSYGDTLLGFLREGIGHLSASELIVELNPGGLELLAERVAALAGELSVSLKVEASNAFEGGLRVFTADRRMLFDNSLSARLNRMENSIRQDIWRELFGAEQQEH
jgi:V/A-type H+/Na+-transporting ATPase subunit E